MEAIRVSTVDYHTAGEPFRIVLDGGPTIPGANVLERREAAATRQGIDQIRQLLVQEPRGHADMYGCFIVPPNDDDADFGVLFWHKDGYSTACGHGTIALGAWAVESGRVASDHDGETVVSIDAPSGRVRARVNKRAGVIIDVAFENVGSFVSALDVPLETSRGSVTVDIGYGGAFYASLPAAAVELSVSPADHDALVAIGREIKWALHDSGWVEHPSDDRLGGLYGTIWYDDLGRSPEGGPHQRNVTIFADGEVDRSPCGSGTSARLAVLHARDEIAVGEPMTHDSIIGTRFTGRIMGHTTVHGLPAVITEIAGTAFETGRSTFVLDPHDPLGSGFLLR